MEPKARFNKQLPMLMHIIEYDILKVLMPLYCIGMWITQEKVACGLA